MQHEKSTAVGPPGKTLVQLLLHRNIFGAARQESMFFVALQN
jgi:hypothetical protein